VAVQVPWCTYGFGLLAGAVEHDQARVSPVVRFLICQNPIGRAGKYSAPK
jgi:hypothetical protein